MVWPLEVVKGQISDKSWLFIMARLVLIRTLYFVGSIGKWSPKPNGRIWTEEGESFIHRSPILTAMCHIIEVGLGCLLGPGG